MQYRNLGRHGLALSVLGMDFRAAPLAGLARGTVRELLAAMLDGGVNYLHTRTALGDSPAQQLLGELIGDLHIPRDQYCLGVQLGAARQAVPWPTQRGLSRKAVRDACDQTLRRMGVDYLDLVLCEGVDPDTPPAETLGALEDLSRQGKLLYWGLSGWPSVEAEALLALAASRQSGGPVALHAVSGSLLPSCPDAMTGLGRIVDLSPLAGGKAAETAGPLTGLLADPDFGTLVVPARDRAGLEGWLAAAVPGRGEGGARRSGAPT